MQHWLVKQEPEAYSWAKFVKDGRAAWTGVRNFQARNNLRAMKKGDWVLYYHSVSEKQVVGLARVAKEAYPDPTAKRRRLVLRGPGARQGAEAAGGARGNEVGPEAERPPPPQEHAPFRRAAHPGPL